MGLTIREMIDDDFFQEFRVIAGRKGLQKQIQGVAILDAPDGFRWTRGRELVLSSGYLFQENPGLFEEIISGDAIKRVSGFGIKVDRYVDKIPMKVIRAFEDRGVPLLLVPVEPSWMEIMNQLNVLVMNKSIKRFGIGRVNPKSYSNLPYQSRKINKILSQIESEMKFPAMLYDLTKEKAYYSSPSFSELSKELATEDFWNPGFDHTEEVLCDNLTMIRYRFIDEKYDRPYSWITIPITVGGKIKAYFVVVEATELIDYFDQFALRIGFLLIQSLYEQILVAQSLEDMGFEKFMKDLFEERLIEEEMIHHRAEELGLDTRGEYIVVLMEERQNSHLEEESMEAVRASAANVMGRIEGRITPLNQKQWVLLVPINRHYSRETQITHIREVLLDFQARLKRKIQGSDFFFGLVDIAGRIADLKRQCDRGMKILTVAPKLETGLGNKKEQSIHTYSELGVFAWMDIQEDEFDIMTRDIKALLSHEGSEALMETLKVYLACKMNYSLAAKNLYIHINTVRKRMDTISDLISFDLEDSTNRLKLELLLQFL